MCDAVRRHPGSTHLISHLRHECKLHMVGLMRKVDGVARQVVYCTLHAGRCSAVSEHKTSDSAPAHLLHQPGCKLNRITANSMLRTWQLLSQLQHLV
jgi:hypothetical protein